MTLDHIIFILDKLDEPQFNSLNEQLQGHHLSGILFLKDQAQLKQLNQSNASIDIKERLSFTNILEHLRQNTDLKADEAVIISDEPEALRFFRRSGFGMLMGVGKEPENIYRQLADDAIKSVDNLSISEIKQWFADRFPDELWSLNYPYFEPQEELLRETMTTVGNGFIGHRNALSFMKADEDTHYPGTYIAGLFNKTGSEVQDRTIYNNDFVNIPNAFLVQFKFDHDTNYWSMNDLKIDLYQHRLDMKTGEAIREMLLQHQDGRQVKYICRQLASMKNKHLLGHQVSIQPLNFSGKLRLNSAIDGDIINYGVPRYRKLNSKHFKVVHTYSTDNQIHLEAQTLSSKVDIAIDVFHHTTEDSAKEGYNNLQTTALQFEKQLSKNEIFELERSIFIETSRNRLDNKVQKQALRYHQIRSDSAAQWNDIWRNIDIKISGDRYSQELIRLQLYHLMCSASPRNTEFDAGMTARGLHGEAYRGHIFWDELFILPFYFKHFPEVAKSLMMYRYRRLEAARANARKNDRKGALIPWQIADTGEEETQEIHYNPMSGDWDPDLSRKQRHVSIAVAFNLINYYHHTRDEEFLAEEGGEMLLEIVRYWASKVIFDKADERYHVLRVMGPDEFHEKYPKNPVTDGGIDDNAYTNLMLSWLLKRTLYLLPIIARSVKSRIEFEEEKETKQWQNIAEKLYVSTKDDVLEQFKGYFKLKDIDWEYYEKEYGDIGRMDRILKSEDDSPDNYKVAKQADTLMLFYLLEAEEVADLIKDLGYNITDAQDLLQKNFDHYIARTSHGSTLSYVVHAYLLDRLPGRHQQLWQWFQLALNSDVDDIQGGTTKEGIHCGVMAGNINLVYNCFAGIKMGDVIRVAPDLPAHWSKLEFHIKFRERHYDFIITKEKIIIQTDTSHDRSVLFKGKRNDFEKTEKIEFNRF